jgi:branched-chain amino acid transport system permease protein
MPIKLRERSAAHRAYVLLPWAVAIGALVYVPFAGTFGFSPASIDSPFRIGQLNQVMAYAVAILGLNIVTGFSGQLSLGQSAFVGVGAYTTVILVADHGWNYYATIPAAVLVCFVAGLAIGIPATRIRGLYLAVVTLVVAYVFPALILRYDWLTGGPNGKGPARTEAKLLPPSWVPFADEGRLAGPLWVYCLCLALAAVLFVLARTFIRSAPGRALIAVRDHETGAAASGINVALYKATAFGISAVCGGLAGTMLMLNRPFASDVQFAPKVGIFLVVGLVVGGVGTISGSVVGAFVYFFMPYFVSQWTFDQGGMPPVLRQVTSPLFKWLHPAGAGAVDIFFGLALLLLMFVLPGGFVNGFRRLRARVVTVVPEPQWLGEVRPATPEGAGAPAMDVVHSASTTSR